MYSRKRLSKGKLLKRLFIFFILIILLFHVKDICRLVFPIPYKEIIFQQAQINQLDPYLLTAVIKTESNFNPKAVSPKGAVGMMQIMPETGEWAAQQSKIGNYSLERLYDPVYNINIGSWYLADLQKEFANDTTLMLAAYNGGRGNVKNWLATEIWDGQYEKVSQIPFAETQKFVQKVLWYQKIYSTLYS